MNINIIEKLAKRLFGRINGEINGYKLYTKAEIKEDKENFVNAILSENIDYIKEKYNTLEHGDAYQISLYRQCIELMARLER